MGWATTTASKVEVTTATNMGKTDPIYYGGVESEDADVNYYPSPSSCGGTLTSASSDVVRGSHLALPYGFCLCWDDGREKELCCQKGGVGRGRGIGVK